MSRSGGLERSTWRSDNHADPLFPEHQTLTIEVLSAGTEGFDRGAKSAAYRRWHALRET